MEYQQKKYEKRIYLYQKMKSKLTHGGISEKFYSLPIQVRTSFVYLLCSIFQKGVTFLVIPLYTRLVSTEQYGVYSVYQSWDMILIIFATLNMWNYLFNNGMTKYKEQRDEFTSALIGLSGLITSFLGVLFLVFDNSIYKVIGLPKVAIVLMFVDFYLRPSYEFWCARQRFEYNVKPFAIASTGIVFSTPILSVILIRYFQDFLNEDLGVGLIFAKVFCSSIVYIGVLINLLRRCKCLFSQEIWKYALKFNLPLIPHFLSTIILAQADRIMIGSMCGKSETAIYSVAYGTSTVMIIINSALMDSMIPWIYKGLEKKKYNNFDLVSSGALGIIALVNFGLVLCAPEIIRIMAPEEYYRAIYIIPPVAISNVFIFMFNLFANIEYYYEKTRFVAFASVISAIANVALNYLFIPQFGFVAAGYTTVFCYILYAFLHFCSMKVILKKQKIDKRIYNNKLLWMIAFASLFLSIGVSALYSYTKIRMIIIALIIFLTIMSLRKITQFVVGVFRDRDFE